MSKQIFAGKSKLHFNTKEVELGFVDIDGEDFYKIQNVDQMDPFFMTVVSSSDHWMFISSNGGLSAGRKNAENSLFPYYSDDKITASSENVGSKTIIKVLDQDKVFLWEPFSVRSNGLYQIDRNLYKNRLGDTLLFEEINYDLSVGFRYRWRFSETFGFIKQSEVFSVGEKSVELEVLDGLQGLLPYGVGTQMQHVRSNLVDGYKRNVLDIDHSIGVFSLSAMIVDRAEPSEALRATTVWSTGLDSNGILLSSRQLGPFRRGEDLNTETDIKGSSGSYFIHSKFDISSKSSQTWYLVADINQDRADLNDLSSRIKAGNILEELLDDIKETSNGLTRLLSGADAFQLTEDELSTGRHLSNVLFNVMRGGVFEDDYQLDVSDFLNYLNQINNGVFNKYTERLPKSGQVDLQKLFHSVMEIGDADLTRITIEYLPLTFSRRHGDPSRPWNQFNIDLKNSDGTKKRSYEGNWRDIFQNWEALAYSYPEYITGMIFKFLNATTIDGYNPYRITREGIDWEVIEPDDPWSYIGYWGDHQIIYLQKLLECGYRHNKRFFRHWMNEGIFVFANVPYDIASYDRILLNPQDTIDFNSEKEELIEERVEKIGADGKFVMRDDQLVKATMMEKILVTLLAKFTNFVPEGGIWLNTQRPEWNDANNALVGNGLSMVTLYYMRRFCQFLMNVVEEADESYEIHKEVGTLFKAVHQVFTTYWSEEDSNIPDSTRKKFVDELGIAGENYRTQAYVGFVGQKSSISNIDLIGFLELALQYIDRSIQVNKRSDGLYHSYNLLDVDGDNMKINHLYEMLEGQVAVLSSGLLTGAQSLAVLDGLKSSAMFRKDQYSYFLYPNREISHFLNKNKIPADFAENSRLFKQLRKEGNRDLVTYDEEGNFYFNGTIHNASDVTERLNEVAKSNDLVEPEKEKILEVFEEMFDHKSFTGRSGTFFAFEGLGSIYWHMVSKLLLATQETIYRCADELNEEERGRLIQHYYEIRAGIGINKNPSLYGAFPTDPYSHTPFHKGAQQPGMTGQVKEDVLNRWAELGVQVNDGILSFKPEFLSPKEFLDTPATFKFYNLDNELTEIKLNDDQLVFTYCQIPVVYQRSAKGKIVVYADDKIERESQSLTKEESREVFKRSGSIKQITVFVSVD